MITLRTKDKTYDSLHAAVDGRKKATVDAQAVLDLLIDHSVMYRTLIEKSVRFSVKKDRETL